MIKIMKKTLFISVIFLFMIFTESILHAKVYKLADIVPKEHPNYKSLSWFVKEVDERLHLKIKIYPNAVLGNATTTLQMVQNGTLAFSNVGGAVLPSFSNKYKVLSLPYLYKNRMVANRILNGNIGDRILSSSKKDGFIGLAFLDAGSRNFYTDKEIITPSDLKGLKIRVLSSPILIETMKLLKATPVPIPYTEVYSALQQGVVDGAENNIPSYYSSQHYEVKKIFNQDQHARIPDILVVSSEVWDTFTREQRVSIKKIAKEMAQRHIKNWDNYTELSKDQLKKKNVKFIQPKVKLFQEAVKSLYTDFRKQNPELISILDEILNAQN